jgi:hypothetical protein
LLFRSSLHRRGPANLAPLPSALKAHQPTQHLYVLGTFPGHEGALFLGVEVIAELPAFRAEVHAALAGTGLVTSLGE